MYLPLETQSYIFRILSIKLIYGNPGKYGFNLSKEDFYPPLEFERVDVTCSEDIPIRVIAQAAQTHFKMIKDLNPELRGYNLSEGEHSLLVPRGASRDFQQRCARQIEKWKTDKRRHIYVVQKGDNLSKIAERFKVPLSALLIWNRRDPNAILKPGDRLILYREEQETTAPVSDRE